MTLNSQDGKPDMDPGVNPETSSVDPMAQAVKAQASEEGPSPLTPGEIPFRFSGTGGGYFKIWLVNLLLSIVTLGIYSAWAKVRRKQYFYGNTSVSGAAFRYLADPMKILKGRLVVFAGFLVYSIMVQIFPVSAPVFGFILLLFMPWLVVRSLAFNARNSSWRNIRFNFKGTYAQGGKVFVAWPLLVPFTLGLILPYVIYRQKKFVVENSYYGSTPFSFHAKPRDYYAVFFRFLGVLLVLILLLFSGGVAVHFIFPDMDPQLATGAERVLIQGVPFTLIMMIYLYAFVYFSVQFSNLLYNSGSLDGHRFRAAMKTLPYAGIVLTNTLITVLTLGFYLPLAQVRAFRYKVENLALLPQGDLDRFVAESIQETSALGDEMSDMMDFDFGL